jgi:hypothetical protein
MQEGLVCTFLTKQIATIIHIQMVVHRHDTTCKNTGALFLRHSRETGSLTPRQGHLFRVLENTGLRKMFSHSADDVTKYTKCYTVKNLFLHCIVRG